MHGLFYPFGTTGYNKFLFNLCNEFDKLAEP